MTLSPGLFLDRHRLAGDHRFIDRAVSLEHDAVDRNLFAGAHAQLIAGHDLIERDIRPRVPSGRRGGRVFGARSSSARIALDGLAERARNSSTWPSSTSVTMTAAASK